jgi:hypothetical protein
VRLLSHARRATAGATAHLAAAAALHGRRARGRQQANAAANASHAQNRLSRRRPLPGRHRRPWLHPRRTSGRRRRRARRQAWRSRCSRLRRSGGLHRSAHRLLRILRRLVRASSVLHQHALQIVQRRVAPPIPKEAHRSGVAAPKQPRGTKGRAGGRRAAQPPHRRRRTMKMRTRGALPARNGVARWARALATNWGTHAESKGQTASRSRSALRHAASGARAGGQGGGGRCGA